MSILQTAYPDFERRRLSRRKRERGIGAGGKFKFTFLRHNSTCESIHGAQVQVDVWFGETLHLCGYAVSSDRAAPGEEISVTFW